VLLEQLELTGATGIWSNWSTRIKWQLVLLATQEYKVLLG
jgi:hypothetical protein